MGTYISILKYSSHESREKFKEKILELIQKYGGIPFPYKQFYIKIGSQRIRMDLKIRFREQKTINGSPMILVEIDGPKEVVNLDGIWEVKEKWFLTLFFYEDDEELEDIVLVIGESSKGVKTFLKNMHHLSLPRPQAIKLRFIRTSEFVEKISKLGSLGWIWLSRITDSSLSAAGFWGKDLQSSEVVSELLRRGGEVTALVVVNERKGLKIIISDKGSIYSQKKLAPALAAGELGELIKFFKNSGIFVFE